MLCNCEDNSGKGGPYSGVSKSLAGCRLIALRPGSAPVPIPTFVSSIKLRLPAFYHTEMRLVIGSVASVCVCLSSVIRPVKALT